MVIKISFSLKKHYNDNKYILFFINLHSNLINCAKDSFHHKSDIWYSKQKIDAGSN